MAIEKMAWDLFCKTGKIDFYLLYNELNGKVREGERENAVSKDQRLNYKAN